MLRKHSLLCYSHLCYSWLATNFKPDRPLTTSSDKSGLDTTTPVHHVTTSLAQTRLFDSRVCCSEAVGWHWLDVYAAQAREKASSSDVTSDAKQETNKDDDVKDDVTDDKRAAAASTADADRQDHACQPEAEQQTIKAKSSTLEG